MNDPDPQLIAHINENIVAGTYLFGRVIAAMVDRHGAGLTDELADDALRELDCMRAHLATAIDQSRIK